jgi:predicted transcriptional regulator
VASPAKNSASSPVLPTHLDRNDRKALEAIATASTGPAEAYFLVRGLLQRDLGSEVLDATYDSFRSLVHYFLSSRVAGEQVDLWTDVILRVRQLFRAKNETAAERLTVLADLLGQSSRFADLQPTEDLRRRKHVRSILEILANSDRLVGRSRIAELTKLRPANLSRVLTNLETVGWITREQSGREVSVTITPEGRRLGLGQKVASNDGNGPFDSSSALKILRDVWEKTGATIAMSAAGVGFVACDPEFAKLLGFADPSEVVGQNEVVIRQRIADMSAESDEVTPDEIVLEDGSCVRVVEHRLGDTSLWLGSDVTSYKKRIEAYARRERTLLDDIDALRRIQPRKAKAAAAAAIDHLFAFQDQSLTAFDLATYLGSIRQDVLFPMTAINNAAHQMKVSLPRSAGDTDSLLEQIELVAVQSDRIRNAIRDLVYMGGSTAALAVTSFKPATVIHDVAQSLLYTCRSLDQSFEFPSLVEGWVETDELLFRSTIKTMIAGIMNMTPTGGKIAIETRKVDDTVQFVVRTKVARGAEYWAPPVHLNLCRQAVARIGGQCNFKASRSMIVAEVSVPVLPKTAALMHFVDDEI